LSLRKTGFSAVLLLLVTLCLSPAPASAAYLFNNWSSAQVVTDPLGDTTFAGRDIVAAYQAYSNGYLYFRIDLAAAPSGQFPPGYANTYGLYIDSKAGGAPTSNEYIPGQIQGIGPLVGIDFIVSSEVELERHYVLDWDPALQTWKRNDFQQSDELRFQQTENNGKTLEWRVKDGAGTHYIGPSFTWWAGTMLPGEGSAKKTYDLTGASVFPSSPAVPIPSAVWLLGSGVIGLIGLKRRTNKRDKSVS
jgi:hypothetical protein